MSNSHVSDDKRFLVILIRGESGQRIEEQVSAPSLLEACRQTESKYPQCEIISVTLDSSKVSLDEFVVYVRLLEDHAFSRPQMISRWAFSPCDAIRQALASFSPGQEADVLSVHNKSSYELSGPIPPMDRLSPVHYSPDEVTALLRIVGQFHSTYLRGRVEGQMDWSALDLVHEGLLNSAPRFCTANQQAWQMRQSDYIESLPPTSPPPSHLS